MRKAASIGLGASLLVVALLISGGAQAYPTGYTSDKLVASTSLTVWMSPSAESTSIL